MNRLNLIILHPEDCLSYNAELHSALNDLPLDVQYVTQDIFLHNPQSIKQGAQLFVLGEHSIADPSLCRQIKQHLRKNPQQVSLCLLPHAEIISQDGEFFTGFHDFLIWPCSASEIRARLLKFLQPYDKNFAWESKLLQEFAHLHLTGQSPIFIKTISLIKRMASCHASVLIQGETGTGKENAARAIHYLSNRRDHAFIPINCAAIPDELLESELFGHEKGTFTDAKTKQVGLVGLAQLGTLFLDEVDSLTPKAQAALLRFLQTQEYRPLGSKITLQADVRILAATNANLKTLVDKKLFREDLYFRLNILNLNMPPLRHRREDIPLLASALLEKFSQQYAMGIKIIHPQTINYLMQQPWAGNIRELENILLRHFLLSSDSMLIIDQHSLEDTDLNQPLSPQRNLLQSAAPRHSQLNFQNAKAQAINEFEEHYLKELMAMAEGNVSAAARIAGKERRSLGKLLQKHHIQKKSPYVLTHCD